MGIWLQAAVLFHLAPVQAQINLERSSPEWLVAIEAGNKVRFIQWFETHHPTREYIDTLVLPELRDAIRRNSSVSPELIRTRTSTIIGQGEILKFLADQENVPLFGTNRSKKEDEHFLEIKRCKFEFAGIGVDDDRTYSGSTSAEGGIGSLDFRFDYQWYKPPEKSSTDQATVELSHEFELSSNYRIAIGGLYFKESEKVESTRRAVPYVEFRKRWEWNEKSASEDIRENYFEIKAGLGCVVVFGGHEVEETWGVGPKLGFEADFGIFSWLRNRGSADWVHPILNDKGFDPYTISNFLYVPVSDGLSVGIEYSKNDVDFEQITLMFEYLPGRR